MKLFPHPIRPVVGVTLLSLAACGPAPQATQPSTQSSSVGSVRAQAPEQAYPLPVHILEVEERRAVAQDLVELSKLRWDSVVIDPLGRVSGAMLRQAPLPSEQEQTAFGKRTLQSIIKRFGNQQAPVKPHNLGLYPGTGAFVAGAFTLAWHPVGPQVEVSLIRQGPYDMARAPMDSDSLARAAAIPLPQKASLLMVLHSPQCTPPPGRTCPEPPTATEDIVIDKLNWKVRSAIVVGEEEELEVRLMATVTHQPVRHEHQAGPVKSTRVRWEDTRIPELRLDAVTGEDFSAYLCLGHSYELVCGASEAKVRSIIEKLGHWHPFSASSGEVVDVP